MKFEDLEKSTQVILKITLVVLVLGFLWEVRDIIILLLLAVILAAAMEPVVGYLHQKKVPRIVSVLMVYVLVIGLGVLIVYLIIPPVIQQFKVLQENIPTYSQAIQNNYSWLLGGVSVNDWFQQSFGSTFSGSGVVSSTFGAFTGVLDFIAVLVIAFYLVAEKNGMQSFVKSVVPSRSHDIILGVVTKVQNKMGMWMLGQMVVSLGIFIFTYIGLLILHVQFALVLALIAGFMEIIPYIGPFVSAIPAIFIAFTQQPPHPSLVVAVIVLYLLVHELEGYVLVPKIMEKTVGTSPLTVMVALLVGFKLAGVVGLLISVPIAAAITVIVNEFWPGKGV